MSHRALRFDGHSKKPGREREWDGKPDPLWKIRSLITGALKNIGGSWTCYQQLMVDESMVRLNSKRCKFVQFMCVVQKVMKF